MTPSREPYKYVFSYILDDRIFVISALIFLIFDSIYYVTFNILIKILEGLSTLDHK